MDELARKILDEGKFLSRIEFQGVEISLYRFEGEPVEIWFYFDRDEIEIRRLKGNLMNPYLKHINENNFN